MHIWRGRTLYNTYSALNYAIAAVCLLDLDPSIYRGSAKGEFNLLYTRVQWSLAINCNEWNLFCVLIFFRYL